MCPYPNVSNVSTHTDIQTERTQSLLGPVSGTVAGVLAAITVLGIAIAVVVYCKKNVKHTEDPLYDYIDTEDRLYDCIDTDDGPTFPMQPISYSLETATNTAYGTTYM